MLKMFGSAILFWFAGIYFINKSSADALASSCDALPWLHTCEFNGYDKTVPPQLAKDGGTTDVKIEIYVESIGNFKAGTMDYDMDIYFVEFWTDERLSHNYSDFLSFNERKQLDRIWYVTIDKGYQALNGDPSWHDQLSWADLVSESEMPDLYFANSKSADYNFVTVPNMVLKLHPDGKVRYSVRLNLKISCHMKLQAYPIDTQECYLKIVTYGSTKQMVNAIWIDGNAPIIMDPQITATDLSVYDVNAGYCNGSYFNMEFSCLLVTFYLERNIGYSLLQVYIPTTFIVIISWMSFWIDPTSVPGRVALAVTTLLTLSTQAIGLHYQLPPVSYAKAQDIWFAVCILFLFAALVEFALVNMYTRRCDDIAAKQKAADYKRRRGALTGGKVELLCEVANNMYTAPTKPFSIHPDDPLLLNDKWVQAKRAAINIDKYSRIIFPSLFAFFCIVYSFSYQFGFTRSKAHV